MKFCVAWKSWTVVWACSLALPSNLWSQTDGHAHQKPHETWQYTHSDDRFSATMQKLDDAVQNNQGKFSLLYIGGSHVQDGWLGHELRNQWQQFAPHVPISRGMMLPYRIANTNTPTHFRTNFSGTWSGKRCTRNSDAHFFQSIAIHTGIAVETRSTQSSWTHWAYQPDSTLHSFQEIEVWTNAKQTEVVWGGANELTSVKPLPQGIGWIYTLNEPVDTICFHLKQSNPDEPLQLFGIMGSPSTESTPFFALHEWGHNGCKSEHLVNSEGWEALIQRLQPDLILIGVGVNDAHTASNLDTTSFANHMGQFVRNMLQLDEDVAILLLSNTIGLPNHPTFTKNNFAVSACLNGLAQRTPGVGFYDLNSAMGGPESFGMWHEKGLVKKDEIHFESNGYIELSKLIFDSWIEAYALWRGL